MTAVLRRVLPRGPIAETLRRLLGARDLVGSPR
jgi:hypothetical protein